MKPHYIIIKVALLFFAVLNLTAFAQSPVEYLAVNNVKAPVCIGGNLFYNKDTSLHISPMYEVPKGSGIPSIFTSALWLTATDAGGNLKCAAQRYCDNGHDFYDGPINANGIYDSVYDNFFRRVFKVTRSQIEAHEAAFLANPNNLNSNAIDPAILYWPARGNGYIAINYGVSITSRLAPFFDADGDDVYDPAKGDHPDVCSDEAIFFVFNDVRGPHSESGGQPLGVEVRGLAEVFIDTTFGGFNAISPAKRAINNTVFLRFEMDNKSAGPLFDLQVGMFQDIDLGCFANDLVGCDTSRQLMFAYNGTTTDISCMGISGYGNNHVAMGTRMLNAQLSSFCYFVNGNPTAYDDPTSPQGYRNYTSGHWNSGAQYTYGGAGFGGQTATNYIFSGNPQNPNEWSDLNNGVLQPGDRRMIGASRLGSLQANQTLKLDYAIVTSIDSNVSILDIVDTLQAHSDQMQHFYDNVLSNCHAYVAAGVTDEHGLNLAVYPNPTSSQLIIESPVEIAAIQLTNMLGQVVFTAQGNSTKQVVDVSALAKGIYLLKVSAGAKEAVQKVVIE